MSSEERIVNIKSVDMCDNEQRHAIRLAIYAVDRFTYIKQMANYIKEWFDEAFDPTWHCVVGRDFGSCVSCEKHNHIYFYVDEIAFYLFKMG